MQINQSAAVANWNLFFLYVSQKPKSCKVCIFATPCSPKTTFSHKNPHNLNHHHQRKVLLKVFAELSVECKLPISATEWKVVYGKTLISNTNNTSTPPHLVTSCGRWCPVELQTKVRKDFTIREKAPTRLGPLWYLRRLQFHILWDFEIFANLRLKLFW